MTQKSSSPCRVLAVLFDFGGVLADEGFLLGLTAMAAREGLDPEAVVKAGYETVWDSGFVLGRAPESAFWALFRERSGITGDDATLTRLCAERFALRPWMLDWARRLRALGIKTAILSDQTHWLDEYNREWDFFRHFDRVFNSYHHGMSKKEDAFFQLALKELGLPAAQALFIDDNPGNVDRARALGLATILYTDRVSFERQLLEICPTLE